ncbi:Lectin C-type domain family protein [Brugia pahangi]
MSQINARLSCASKNAFLASIESAEENEHIRSLLLDENVESAYIGLQSVPYDVTQRYFCTGETIDYTNWLSGKPDNKNIKDNGCVILNAKNGKWIDYSCDANDELGPWATICQIKDTREEYDELKCPKGFEYCSNTKNCYKVIIKEKGMNQTEAQNECKTYNAHLVSIDSEEENQFVSDLSMKHPLSAMRIFIGLELHQTDDINEQHWLDGTTTDYTKWDYMKPDRERARPEHECVIMIPERHGVWSNWSCADSCCAKHAIYGAICEIDHDDKII